MPRGRDKNVQVVGHDYEWVQSIAAFIAAVKESFTKKAGAPLRLQEPFSIRSDDGDEPSLQQGPHAT